MNEFEFDLEDGEMVKIEYEPVDEDERGNIEFEIYAYNEDGKEIYEDINASDQHKIEAKVKRDWDQYYRYEKNEAAITRWESERDFK